MDREGQRRGYFFPAASRVFGVVASYVGLLSATRRTGAPAFSIPMPESSFARHILTKFDRLMALAPKTMHLKPVSAGYVKCDGNSRCLGHSQSLGLASRPDRDTRVLQIAMAATARTANGQEQP
jgi:hypothetical protein